jgi:transcriptional regulator with XRE-family HTH domain
MAIACRTNPIQLSTDMREKKSVLTPHQRELQMIRQLGERLKSLRKGRGLGMDTLARKLGMSRATVTAVESGYPGTSILSYLQVMTALEVSREFELVCGSLGPKSERPRNVVHMLIALDVFHRQLKDFQTATLNDEVSRLASANVDLLPHASKAVSRLLKSKASRISR